MRAICLCRASLMWILSCKNRDSCENRLTICLYELENYHQNFSAQLSFLPSSDDLYISFNSEMFLAFIKILKNCRQNTENYQDILANHLETLDGNGCIFHLDSTINPYLQLNITVAYIESDIGFGLVSN